MMMICNPVEFRDHQKEFNTQKKKEVNVVFRRLEKIHKV